MPPTATASIAYGYSLYYNGHASTDHVVQPLAGQAASRGEKVVVFSAWTRLLALAAAALTAQRLGCASLVGSVGAKQDALRRFGALSGGTANTPSSASPPACHAGASTSADDGCLAADQGGEGGSADTSGGAAGGAADGAVSGAAGGAAGMPATPCVALLVPLFAGSSGAGGSGAAGLNLHVASVAVLLEPSLQPGIEQQAVGRICRIGQERPTKCIRLIVEASIEPNILLWQSRRLAQGCKSASGHAPLGLNDFVHVFGHQRGGRTLQG